MWIHSKIRGRGQKVFRGSQFEREHIFPANLLMLLHQQVSALLHFIRQRCHNIIYVFATVVFICLYLPLCLVRHLVLSVLVLVCFYGMSLHRRLPVWHASSIVSVVHVNAKRQRKDLSIFSGHGGLGHLSSVVFQLCVGSVETGGKSSGKSPNGFNSWKDIWK